MDAWRTELRCAISMLAWDDLRIFLAVARQGSLSSAARVLRTTQPTVGRRLRAMERRLHTRFFERTPRGYALTDAGRSVLAHVTRMEEDALAVERLADGRDTGLSGTVRITASEWVATRVVGPRLAPFLAAHPALRVDVVADARHLSLPRREADIALRPRPFDEADVVQRKLGPIAFALYASRSYLQRAGQPDFAAACAGHAVIAMSDGVGDVARPWLDDVARLARIASRTNGREPMAAMAAAGVGLACLPRVLGDATPELVRLATPTAAPAPLLYLGVHRDSRTLPRVRAVMQHLTANLANLDG